MIAIDWVTGRLVRICYKILQRLRDQLNVQSGLSKPKASALVGELSGKGSALQVRQPNRNWLEPKGLKREQETGMVMQMDSAGRVVTIVGNVRE